MAELQTSVDTRLIYGGIVYPPSVSEILPGLYLGNVESSEDPETYRRHGITTRVSLLTFKPAGWQQPGVIDSVRLGDDLCIHLPNSETADLLAHFDNVYRLIENRLARRESSAAAVAVEQLTDAANMPENIPPSSEATPDALPSISPRETRVGAVLVHCEAGISRSASVVISYLMKKRKLAFEEARDFVVGKRPCVRPNPGFCQQLAIWESTGYDVWEDQARTVPKEAYRRWLARSSGEGN